MHDLRITMVILAWGIISVIFVGTVAVIQYLYLPVFGLSYIYNIMEWHCTCVSGEDEEDYTFSNLVGEDSTEPEFEKVSKVEGAPTEKKWYHAKISNEEAERRLRQGSRGHNGSYIVYDNPHRSGQYILIMIHDEMLYRWKIMLRVSDGKYIIGNDSPGVVGYSTVKELIKAHRGFKGKTLKTERGKSLKLSREYVYIA